MKIELKNIKHAVFASQETPCFRATVFLGGVRTGTVENTGQGGCNTYHPWSMSETLNDYAKTLPPMEFLGKTFTNNADTLIGKVLDRSLSLKTLRGLLKRRILFTRAKKIYQTNIIENIQVRLQQEDLCKKLNAEVILNLLPEAEALTYYMEAA